MRVHPTHTRRRAANGWIWGCLIFTGHLCRHSPGGRWQYCRSFPIFMFYIYNIYFCKQIFLILNSNKTWMCFKTCLKTVHGLILWDKRGTFPLLSWFALVSLHALYVGFSMKQLWAHTVLQCATITQLVLCSVLTGITTWKNMASPQDYRLPCFPVPRQACHCRTRTHTNTHTRTYTHTHTHDKNLCACAFSNFCILGAVCLFFL